MFLSFSSCLPQASHFEGFKSDSNKNPNGRSALAEYEFGLSLYKSKNCASCHNADITSSDVRHKSAAQILIAISGNISEMRGIQLSEEEAAALEYVLNNERPSGERMPDVVEEPAPPNNFDSELYNLGVQVYSTKSCNLCHGSEIQESKKRGIDLTRLNNAIGPGSPIVQMRSISLSVQEKDALIYALNTMPPKQGEAPPVTKGQYHAAWVPVGVRHLIASRFQAHFLRNGDRDQGLDGALISNIIDAEIAGMFERYGGSCTAFDAAECMEATVSVSSMMPKSSSIRAASLMNVCEKVLSVNGALENLFANAGVSLSSPVNSANIDPLWTFMIPLRSADQSILNAFSEFGSQAQSRSLSRRDTWRFIALKICQSPHYEAL